MCEHQTTVRHAVSYCLRHGTLTHVTAIGPARQRPQDAVFPPSQKSKPNDLEEVDPNIAQGPHPMESPPKAGIVLKTSP